MQDGSTDGGRHEAQAGPMRTRLFRYGSVNGVPTLTDPQIAGLFERLKEEGLLDPILYSDDVGKITRRSFVEFFKAHGKVFWLVIFDDKLAGLVWLDDFGHRTARMHFCFFKWLTKTRLTVQVARELLWQLLDMKFNRGVSLRVIRGETPAFNKLALRFIRKVGLEVVGEIPHAAYRHSTDTSCPMIISYITKEMLRDHFMASDPEASNSGIPQEEATGRFPGRREPVDSPQVAAE